MVRFRRFLLCMVTCMLIAGMWGTIASAEEQQPTEDDFFENEEADLGGHHYAVVIDKVVYSYNPEKQEYTVVAFDGNHGKIKNGTTIELASVVRGKPVTAVVVYEYDCPNGEVNLIIPNSVKRIILDETTFRSVTIPDSVTPENTCIGSSRIKKIIYTGSPTRIGGCSEIFYLTTVILPDSVRTIERPSFGNCESLQNVVLPEGLETIAENSFSVCKNLSIYVPASVKKIGKGAFTKSIKRMYCVKDSVAHKYAKKNKIPYTLVKSKKTTTYKVTSVTAQKTKLTLKVGKEKMLAYTVKPFYADNQKVKFVSSNAKVATVTADGTVKAVKKGKAVITIKARDGSGKKAKVTITVTK